MTINSSADTSEPLFKAIEAIWPFLARLREHRAIKPSNVPLDGKELLLSNLPVTSAEGISYFNQGLHNKALSTKTGYKVPGVALAAQKTRKRGKKGKRSTRT